MKLGCDGFLNSFALVHCKIIFFISCLSRYSKEQLGSLQIGAVNFIKRKYNVSAIYGADISGTFVGAWNNISLVDVISAGPEASEELGYVMMMEDGAPYHKGAATIHRKELEKVGWIDWGPGTWPSNSPDLNPIKNLWHILRSNIRKRKRQPRNRKELIEALLEEWEK